MRSKTVRCILKAVYITRAEWKVFKQDARVTLIREGMPTTTPRIEGYALLELFRTTSARIQCLLVSHDWQDGSHIGVEDFCSRCFSTRGEQDNG